MRRGQLWFSGVVTVLAASLVGCAKVDPGDVSLNSSALATSQDGGSIFVADADNGSLARINTATGATDRVLLGLEPTRVARIGDTLYVTLRAERSIAVVDASGSGLTVRGIYPIGAEPYGIVASPNGDFLYVVLSTENTVVELDVSSMSIARRFAVEGEPRWVTMHPSGNVLYVGSARAGLFRIELREGEVDRVELPKQDRGEPNTGEIVELTPRVTGDPVLDPSGETLAVPVLYADNTTSAGSMDPLGDGGDGTFEGDGRTQTGGYSGGVTEGIARFNPAVVTFPVGKDGLTSGPATAMLVAGQSAINAHVDVPDFSMVGDRGDVEMDVMFDTGGLQNNFADGVSQVRGYITNIAFNPAGTFIAAALEGNRTVAFLPSKPVVSGQPFENNDLFFGVGNFSDTVRVMLGVEDGPSSVIFAPDGKIYGWSFISRSVAQIDAPTINNAFDAMVTNAVGSNITWTADVPFHLEPSILPPEVQEGRRLFYSATDSSMASAGAGVSCATCHFEGRNDGLTWQFDGGVRQTPSLAGEVSTTAPVTWTNSVVSVAREAEITSQGRMGGSKITAGQKADIAAYVDWSREVDVPLRGSDDPAIARGKAIFESPQAACATCHTGAAYTDNKAHDMVDLVAVNTPGLRGLAVTAPYLHDGRAATLAELVGMADAVKMGRTSHLSADQKADLVKYLESL